MATETTPTEQTAPKVTEQKQKASAKVDPLEKYKVADERNGGLTIYNFTDKA